MVVLFLNIKQKKERDRGIQKYSFSKTGNPFQHLLAAILTIIFLYSCTEKQILKQDAPKEYSVLTVQPHATTTFSDFPATIQGENIVEIRPMVDGYLEAIYVQEGGIVRKGQLLFKIRNPLYDQAVVTANAAIKIALADVNTAKRKL